MSIQPEFVRGIFEGRKQVEFRRKKFKDSVEHVVVYATSPIKAIVGYFSVDGIDEGTPEEIWTEYADVAGIDEVRFKDYFQGTDIAFAIRIGQVTGLTKPIVMADLDSGTVPQSYRYLDDTTLASLKAAPFNP